MPRAGDGIDEAQSHHHSARAASAAGAGEPFESSTNTSTSADLPDFEKVLRRALVLSYAHSRDMEILMDCFGHLAFPGQYYGAHDIDEFLSAKVVRTRLKQSDILRDYIAEVVDDEKAAFEMARRHIEYLHARNELTILA